MEASPDWALVTVRLLRRWVAAREAEQNPLVSIVKLAPEVGQPVQAAIALDSLFALTESCLGRRLQSECCCSPLVSPDERAVLLMIATASASASPMAQREIPHGLPGALSWAAISARRALGGAEGLQPEVDPTRCPFLGLNG